MYREFSMYGKALFDQGLVSLHAGNLSIRDGEFIFIVRSGAALGMLTFKDIVKVMLNEPGRDAGASSETPVHRSIYQQCKTVHAVAHAHCPYALALSFGLKTIEPIDFEGKLVAPKVPVLDCGEDAGRGSPIVQTELPPLIEKHKIAVVRTHGVFAGGKDLEESIGLLMSFESSCKIMVLSRLLKES